MESLAIPADLLAAGDNEIVLSSRGQKGWRITVAQRKDILIEWTIRLLLGTVTPDFDTFVVSIDGGEWRPSADTLNWTLHSGKNRIEMRIRNRAGVPGCKSWIEVEYP